MTAPDTKAIRAQMEALTGFTVGPWYAHNLPGDWGLRGAYSIHVACANPHEWDPCIAQVEYQTPYCLGKKAARTAACNARLIAAAPDMHATILALCDELDTEQSKVRRMGRGVNHAKYGQPDFARGIHLETTAELNAENERLREALALLTVRAGSLVFAHHHGNGLEGWHKVIEGVDCALTQARSALSSTGEKV